MNDGSEDADSAQLYRDCDFPLDFGAFCILVGCRRKIDRRSIYSA